MPRRRDGPKDQVELEFNKLLCTKTGVKTTKSSREKDGAAFEDEVNQFLRMLKTRRAGANK